MQKFCKGGGGQTLQAASGEHWKTMFKIYFGNFKGGEIDTRDPPLNTPLGSLIIAN